MKDVHVRPSARNKPELVGHRDAPVRCAGCGREVARRARQQLYCSQRCRQRAHRAVEPIKIAPRSAATSRHYCRNLKCRSKLPAPIENVRKAFCCRGCHSALYRTRCLVCEKDTGTNPLTGEKRKRLGQRKFCGRKCKAEARQFPHVYAWVLPDPVRRARSSSSCDKMGLKTGPASDRPTSHCLRGWWWGGDGDRDHSLYDRDGLTIARVVLEGDGRYHLQKPIAIPRQAWAHLEEAKRGAESFALIILDLLASFLRRRLAP